MKVDIAVLRAGLRERDPSLPRCGKRILIAAIPYRAEYSQPGGEEMDDYFAHYAACNRIEDHDGPCSATRKVYVWPGRAVLTALLDEVEALRSLTPTTENPDDRSQPR